MTIFDEINELYPGCIENAMNSTIDNNQSEIWLHRCGSLDLYINYDFKNNKLPIVLPYDKLVKERDAGSSISNCDKLEDLFEEDSKVIEKLNEKGISYSYPLVAAIEILKEYAASYFNNGLYTIYVDLGRTAHQCSEKKLHGILKTKALGFPDRGDLNLALILYIPLECIDEKHPQQLYKYAPPRVLHTQYFGDVTSNRVIPREYIKELVAVFGKKTIRVPNPYYNKNYRQENSGDPRLYNQNVASQLKKK